VRAACAPRAGASRCRLEVALAAHRLPSPRARRRGRPLADRAPNVANGPNRAYVRAEERGSPRAARASGAPRAAFSRCRLEVALAAHRPPSPRARRRGRPLADRAPNVANGPNRAYVRAEEIGSPRAARAACAPRAAFSRCRLEVALAAHRLPSPRARRRGRPLGDRAPNVANGPNRAYVRAEEIESPRAARAACAPRAGFSRCRLEVALAAHRRPPLGPVAAAARWATARQT